MSCPFVKFTHIQIFHFTRRQLLFRIDYVIHKKLFVFTIKLVHLFFICSNYSILFQNGPKWFKTVCDKYLCLYSFLRIPVQIFVFVFVFALFCQPKYICICIHSFFQNESICIFIRPFLSTLTYFYSYSSKKC